MNAATVRWRPVLGAGVLITALTVLPVGSAAADPTDPVPSATSESTTAVAGTDPAPQLSIAIDNGRTSAAVGDTLTYTISVQNLGNTDVSDLAISQSVPAGLTLVAADGADAVGAAGTGDVRWTADLNAAATAEFSTTMTVSDTAPDLMRLATIACATLSGATGPLVCASHSDQLPAGAAAASEQARAAGEPMVAAAGPAAGPLTWYYGGATVLVLLLAAAALLGRRSHPAPRADSAR